jgi:hypothetical protein
MGHHVEALGMKLKNPKPIEVILAEVARFDVIVEKAQREPLTPEEREFLLATVHSLHNHFRFPDPKCAGKCRPRKP